jgi:hypothetical protein
MIVHTAGAQSSWMCITMEIPCHDNPHCSVCSNSRGPYWHANACSPDSSRWLNAVLSYRTQMLARDPWLFGGEGEDQKILKINLIKEIYDNIHHTLFLGKLFNKIKVWATLKVTYHSFCAMELMQTTMKTTFWEQVSPFCSLITLLRIIWERRENKRKCIITMLSIVLHNYYT